VSRVTVREALRVLETNGLLEIRIGARGGAFVTKPSKERVGEGNADLLTLAAVSTADPRGRDDLADLRTRRRGRHRRPPDHLRPQDDALDTGDYSINLSAEFH
jgi:GntR family transcriptional repressor for pyruvate dehydrogenase complex